MSHQLSRYGAQHITLPLASKNPLAIWKNYKALVKIIREMEPRQYKKRALFAKFTDAPIVTRWPSSP